MTSTTTNQNKRSMSSGGQKVEAVTWLKLERRALHLEQLLSGMYEKNYELGELAEDLTQVRMALQEGNKTLLILTPEETAMMTSGNEQLKHQVMALEGALKEQSERPKNMTKPDTGTIKFFKDRNANLQAEVNELMECSWEYEVEVERLELLVESFQKSQGDGSVSMEIAVIPEEDGQSVAIDEQYLATQDLNNMMDTIESKSPYATERFLAQKVIDLELSEVAATVERASYFEGRKCTTCPQEGSLGRSSCCSIPHQSPAYLRRDPKNERER
jgi:hypothetical protein